MKKYLGAAALTLAVGATALVPTSAGAATAADKPRGAGTTSLAEVLGADGVKLDRKWGDFDITEAAAYAVIEANPDSPVALLADGKTRLTAFVPTDRAFRTLVKDLTDKKLGTEKKVFSAVAGLGLDTVETVLLYHVVAGATITSDKAAASDDASLTTVQGGKLIVDVRDDGIVLRDQDPDDTNPAIWAVDVNKGNRQVAHVIDRVLRPANL